MILEEDDLDIELPPMNPEKKSKKSKKVSIAIVQIRFKSGLNICKEKKDKKRKKERSVPREVQFEIDDDNSSVDTSSHSITHYEIESVRPNDGFLQQNPYQAAIPFPPSPSVLSRTLEKQREEAPPLAINLSSSGCKLYY